MAGLSITERGDGDEGDCDGAGAADDESAQGGFVALHDATDDCHRGSVIRLARRGLRACAPSADQGASGVGDSMLKVLGAALAAMMFAAPAGAKTTYYIATGYIIYNEDSGGYPPNTPMGFTASSDGVYVSISPYNVPYLDVFGPLGFEKSIFDWEFVDPGNDTSAELIFNANGGSSTYTEWSYDENGNNVEQTFGSAFAFTHFRISDYPITAIPEISTWWMMMVGAASLCLACATRKASA